MITLTRIERTALAQDWHRLLDDVLSNGRPVDLPIRLRLSEGKSLHHVSAAFALQRVCELSYALCPLARALADDLLSAQEDDGSFGSVAATSVVVRALLELRAMPGAEALAERLDFALEQALRLLAQRQDDKGLLGGNSAAARSSPRPSASRNSRKRWARRAGAAWCCAPSSLPENRRRNARDEARRIAGTRHGVTQADRGGATSAMRLGESRGAFTGRRRPRMPPVESRSRRAAAP